ncbi:MAG: 50S ribosomal protein L11 methylase [Elusimicrobia bacterium]|nr:MAG: 50S ribosomal protein L11 methylase [Elusimicrobiota bacterium]KAF0152983.1 MAG: 50S ribosomal protein L11 methylase [Elusimicrobiota bacterium]
MEEMSRRNLKTLAAALLGCAALAAAASAAKPPDVDFVPTPHKVVREMLKLARVTGKDIVYDLGCGDGRIVITAARTAGARAWGFEIDPDLVEEARLNAEKEKVGRLVTIEERDIFTVDLSSASVVMLYLLPELNVKLLPQLARLRPGARIVSHDFGIEGYPPDVTTTVHQYDGKVSAVHLWTAPLRKATDYFALD